MPDPIFSLVSPGMSGIALLIALAGVLAAIRRRPAAPGGALALACAGAAALCLAAGGPVWRKATSSQMVVMVDLSPSTRTADYRNRATLEKRIAALLGGLDHRVCYFAQDIARQPPPGGPVLTDLPADHTEYHPPAGASAVLLFSDARFALPDAAPPTFVEVDAALESPGDARIVSLDARGREVLVRTDNSAGPRQLRFDGAGAGGPILIGRGNLVSTRPIDPAAAFVMARLAGGDAWPENDQLTTAVPPPDHAERWWVGTSNPGAGWRVLSPGAMPADPAAYLAPSIIVLENIAATDLDPLHRQRLVQYVRDLGGGLVIVGGNRAFAAGGYPGSALETLSPLASTPPEPTTRWMLLADGSGSMAQIVQGVSLWRRATDAMLMLIPTLPADDILSVGSFAEQLTWWCAGKTVRQSAALSLPPPGVGPHGPTNLEQALKDIAGGSAGDLPTQLLLLSDADARIDDPAAIAAAFKTKKIRLHLLAVGDGSGLPALLTIVNATGGTLARQSDPDKWTQAAHELMRSATPRLLMTDPLAVHFTGKLSALPARHVAPWNQTWPKDAATPVALGEAGARKVVAGAMWNVGEGRVMALAFGATPAEAETVAAAAARPPRDPRYHVTWDSGPRLRVAVDASGGGAILNDLDIRLELSAEAETIAAIQSMTVPQTGPGRYECEIPAPRSPVFAAVRVGALVIDRVAIAGRYAPEFDAVGNDHAAMLRLAQLTGGQVIPPRQTWPIDLHHPRKRVPLTSVVAMLGVGLIALGLGWWKLTS